MQFQQPSSIHTEVRRSIECALETGNYDRARTIMVEYEEEHPLMAKNLRTELVPHYNVHI